MSKTRFARYNIGQVIRYRLYALRGVIFDVDTLSENANGKSASGGADAGAGLSPVRRR
jgi:heat shock protein HspQ